VVNFRILPGDTGASVLQHVRDTVGPGIHVERKGRFSSEPSRESDAEAPAFKLLQGIENYGEAVRFYAQLIRNGAGG